VPKIALYDPSEYGGITQYTFELAEGLTKIGWTVTVITSEDYELTTLGRAFDVWFLFKQSRLKSWLRAAHLVTRDRAIGHEPSDRWLMGRLRSFRVTLLLFKAVIVLMLRRTRIVHFQWLMDRRADLRFMRLLHLLRFKIVYTAHDVLPHDEDTAENRAFFQQVYQYPDILILHSERSRKEILEIFDVPPEKLRVIPHGCQSVFVDHFGTSTHRARHKLGISVDTRVVLFFGQIKRYKGLEFLLQAFETINSQRDNVILLIAGRIAERDPQVRRHYSRLLEGYSDRPEVYIRDEYIPVDQVCDYFTAADVVVVPYIKASQSGVLLSAYAAGKPVVVTDTGGLSEVVRNGKTGFVVPPKDAAAIARAVIKLLDDADFRRRCGLEAKLLADTVYSWVTISKTTASLYESLVTRRSQARIRDDSTDSIVRPA
jgi:D-inositol-3-phosphate glycosyltransferase